MACLPSPEWELSEGRDLSIIFMVCIPMLATELALHTYPVKVDRAFISATGLLHKSSVSSQARS